ncbi:Os12g0609000 [Oryza sativa Japonica Group]|uniref:Os12g0609000 protein n=1 Tax=Oryza sativa subsp. japonica TaxID=39947 RepID=A0A0P0YBX1_ORYSJ|nr:hypothetical protein EE612_060840 [Oryza sativa]BAT18016.1 Os12g0609000 [Oryza sativa Japonica Group]
MPVATYGPPVSTASAPTSNDTSAGRDSATRTVKSEDPLPPRLYARQGQLDSHLFPLAFIEPPFVEHLACMPIELAIAICLALHLVRRRAPPACACHPLAVLAFLSPWRPSA